MCGRFILTSSLEELLALMPDLFSETPLAPRYNITPSQPVATIVGDGARPRLTFTQWGLVPEWAKDPSIGTKMFNARAETVHEKPAFRNAFKRRRCLLPANGFYEWRKGRGAEPAQPVLFQMNTGGPFFMAGLWEEWPDKEGGILPTSAIITTRSNALVQPSHHRMPVIIARDHHRAWLFSDERDALNLIPLLTPWPGQDMKATPVTPYVNSAAHDDPECIRPLPRQVQGMLF
ncbi:MAG: SOS response-associated peptidase [Spartobacteria bacterium]|nr:SOS response-associated peptidase [Spartobacteria bacterium]